MRHSRSEESMCVLSGNLSTSSKIETAACRRRQLIAVMKFERLKIGLRTAPSLRNRLKSLAEIVL
jgi:hypothetical protein